MPRGAPRSRPGCVEVPLKDVCRFWRHLDNLPHLDSVTETLMRGLAGLQRGRLGGVRIVWDTDGSIAAIVTGTSLERPIHRVCDGHRRILS
jgi:hypothetical protein